MIEVKNISKCYNEKNKDLFYALNDISFTLKDGEVVSLLGHNGAGKTTLIKCLSSLLYPSNGVIEWNGCDIYKNIRNYRRQISYTLGGERGIYNRLTGRENIEYLSALKGVFRKQLKEKINDYVEELEMKEFIDKRAETYSRGMKQKIHLIYALLLNANIIFLDEPTAGMDPISAEKTRNFIKRAVKEEKRTVLITSHIMREVEELSDRIMILFHGSKKFDGDIEYFKKYTTKEIVCNCKLIYSEKSKELIQSIERQYCISCSYDMNIDKGEIFLTLMGKSSKELVEWYIKQLAEVILDINFEQPSLETNYIHYISELEKEG